MKILSLLLAVLLLGTSLAACNNTPDIPADSADMSDTPDTLPADSTTPAESESDTAAPDTEAPAKEKTFTTVTRDGYSLKIWEPSVVAMDPEPLRGNARWGSYQFPVAWKHFSGGIVCTYNMGADSVVPGSYSRPCCYSGDGGETWTTLPSIMDPGNFLTLENGTTIRKSSGGSVDAKAMKLPEAALTRPFQPTPVTTPLYYMSDFPASFNACYFTVNNQSREVILEWPENAMRYVQEGYMPSPSFHMETVAPDGTYWAVGYNVFFADGEGHAYWQPYFVTSEDNGQTFQLRSTIKYEGDPKADPDCVNRFGFCEPYIEFLPNGDIMCLMRTNDITNKAPLYVSYSSDNGYTWSKPTVFADIGVDPKILSLGCGVTLSTYGRPGFFLRSTDDPMAREWDAPITVISHEDTCAYSWLLPLSDTEVLMFYGNWQHRDEKGNKHKAILASRIEIIMENSEN